MIPGPGPATRRAALLRLSKCLSNRSLASAATGSKAKAWSNTLLLPSTKFPLRHKNPLEAELRYRPRTTDELYRKQWTQNIGPTSVLHDGPPYANGNLHMGHALNKILKDIINRYNVIRGRRVHYVPGWDCHGLPIEQKALQEAKKSHTTMSPTAVRERARQTAEEAIRIQKDEFRGLAIMADWDNPHGVYITMKSDFEVRQLRVFQRMVDEGHITHRLRPTYYSPSSRTALAESELSYKDGHKSRSVYVGFAVEEGDMSQGLRRAYLAATEQTGSSPLSLAVWTTTAWTLPANAGVNIGSEMPYVIAHSDEHGLLVLAESRLKPMEDIVGPLRVMAHMTGQDLVDTRYTHTFHPKRSSSPRPIVFASSHVTSESGTGLVHSAPAHGHEDYMAFQKAGLLPDDLRCPIDDEGCFTSEVAKWADMDSASSLVGKSVLGNAVPAVIELLRAQNALLAEETIEHRYPHDWKTKEPVIIRATPQWFADVDAIKPRALKALNSVKFYPPQSQNRLEAFVTSRSEWCISRQRSWGVPIPALYDQSGTPILDSRTVSHIIRVLEEKGTNHWWTGALEEFIPDHLSGQSLVKGTDTLDVWFDSGSSWTLLEESALRDISTQPLADVYLEGSDQHRGWFQSSLLTRLGVRSDETRAPYGSIISHGMVMDEDGNKMSKSAGNGLSPVEVVSGSKDKIGFGADTLRLWAASVDYTRDVSIGPSALTHASETLRKIRSATRFLLANSSGHSIPQLQEAQLSTVDKHVLHELSQLEHDAIEAYDTFAFNRVLQSTSNFISTTLSSFYFDAVKDTLYCQVFDSPDRLAVVATLREVSRVVRKIIAPVIPHLAEELYEHDELTNGDTVFLDTWETNVDRRDPTLAATMNELLALRSHVNRLVEGERSNLGAKSADEVEIYIGADGKGLSTLESFGHALPQILGSSVVCLDTPSGEGLVRAEIELETLGSIRLALKQTSKHKCGRCWKHRSEEKDALCTSCHQVVGGQVQR